jgi:hypothetical protein
MNTIKYTVIIPHKNIPDLLQRCLDSIPRREDIQIIYFSLFCLSHLKS